MINVPDNIYDGLFDNEIKRGYVIKTLFRCYDGTEQPKYFITVSHDISKSPLVFFIATSKTDFYNKHPYFNRDIVRISTGQVSFFPLDTIINCRQVYPFTIKNLKENFKKNVLKFIGKLPIELLNRIDEITRQSYHLSKKDKLLILGDGF